MKSTAFLLFILIGTIGFGQTTEGMELVFADNFDDNRNNWDLEERTVNQSKIVARNNKLALVLFDTGMKRTSVCTAVDFNRDFVVTCEIGANGEAKANKKERSDYGIQFGNSSPRYADQQGWYSIYQNLHENGVYIEVQNGKGFTQVKKVNRSNPYVSDGLTKVGIKKVGDSVTFYHQDKKILTTQAVKTSGGVVSFIGKRSMRAFMSNLQIFQATMQKKELISTDLKLDIELLMDNIQFDGKSARLTEESFGMIQELAEILSNLPDIKLEIQCHTDDEGSSKELLALSQARAAKVRDQLIEYGVKKEKLSSRGYGDYFPLTPNLTEEDRDVNDRISYKVLNTDSPILK